MTLLALIPGVGPVIAFVAAAWSFLTSPLGKIVGVAALVGVAWVHGELHGANRIHEKWKQADIVAKLQAAERDKNIADAIAAQAKQANIDLEQYAGSLDEKVKAYAKELERRKDAACRLSRDDVGRLLDVWKSRPRR